jgi:adenine-specific DNA-methyltransferase
MNAEFHDRTLLYIKNKNIEYRKKLGQYFTPRSIREELLSQLPAGLSSPRVLDPACGTGEFLASAKARYPEASLEGWEIDPELASIARVVAPSGKIQLKDSLEDQNRGLYDLIIGNPPYFEFSPDKKTALRYGTVMNGRPNVFGLFIKLGLDLLKDGGTLAYVVPPSMNNGAYFVGIRDYIVRHANIDYMKILRNTSLFQGALQMVMLLILKKTKNRGDHIFRRGDLCIFSEDTDLLKRSFENSASLRDLGFTVKTGRLVWNQHKDQLTNDPDGAIPLLWAHNISVTGLKFPIIGKKPQFVRYKNYDEGPAILVNRITGAAQNAKIRAAIVPDGMRFIAENHCNVIFPPVKGVPRSALFNAPTQAPRPGMEMICEQIRSEEKLKVMRYVTGNTQISSTELENILPISL